MTPDPGSIMWRAAARAVMKFAVIPDQRDPLYVPARDEVEGDVDAARLGGHSPGVLVDGLLVEGVEFGHLGRPASGSDVLGDRLERLAGASGEEDPGALAGEGPGNAAADPSGGAVYDGVLVLKQQLHPPSIGLPWIVLRGR